MKSSVSTLLAIPLLGLASCASSGGPSGGLIGALTGGTLGALGDHYITNNEGNSTTIQNPNGTTTTIGANGQVTTSGTASNNTSTTVNNGTTGTTGTTTTTDPVTGLVTTTGGTTGTTGTGTTLITSSNNNSGSTIWQDHRGLITGAVAGLAAGAVTDAFRQKEIEKKYDEGYAKAKSDSIKEFYWLKRDAQKTMKGGDDPPIQYRYYEVEVPAHTTSDGVFIDKHKRVIEVVE